MNLFVSTSRIVTQPKLIRYKQKALTNMVLSILNDKKGSFFYTLKAKAKNKLAHEIYDTYRQGDFVIVEGFITIKTKKIITNKNKFRTKKIVTLRINQIHPASIIFK